MFHYQTNVSDDIVTQRLGMQFLSESSNTKLQKN